MSWIRSLAEYGRHVRNIFCSNSSSKVVRFAFGFFLGLGFVGALALVLVGFADGLTASLLWAVDAGLDSILVQVVLLAVAGLS